MLVAADTFRAAAIEQLEAWAKRAEVPLIRQAPNADPAAVVYDAIRAAKGPPARGGHHRHRRAPPHEGQPDGGAQEDEADHGAGASRRAARGPPRPRRDHRPERHRPGADVQGGEIGVTGLVLTKLDGTAKGGVVVRIAKELNIPLRYIGVGEQIDDLRPFRAEEFVDARWNGPRFGPRTTAE